VKNGVGIGRQGRPGRPMGMGRQGKIDMGLEKMSVGRSCYKFWAFCIRPGRMAFIL
jgi:hypothetical protein